MSSNDVFDINSATSLMSELRDASDNCEDDVDLISCEEDSITDTLYNSIPSNSISDRCSPLTVQTSDSLPDFYASEGSTFYFTPENEHRPQQIPTNDDSVAGVFVIAFDNREGNIVEWCYPNNIATEGMEFKAMMCGAHTITSDFIYFQQQCYYGVASYRRISVVSDKERGARMKSVGVLSRSFRGLFKHLEFLGKEASLQVELPGDYTRLLEYYTNNMSILPSHNDYTDLSISRLPASSEPNSSIRELIDYFSLQVMMLWRSVILKKRILLYSSVPTGAACQRVKGIAELGGMLDKENLFIRPMFYVSLTSVDQLRSEYSYIACTTNRVFEHKTSLYDVYIDHRTVHCAKYLRRYLHVTSVDKQQFECLRVLTQTNKISHYFKQRNTLIMNILRQVSSSPDNSLTSKHIRAMGLCPIYDTVFVREVAKVHGFDVKLQLTSTNICCYCCINYIVGENFFS